MRWRRYGARSAGKVVDTPFCALLLLLLLSAYQHPKKLASMESSFPCFLFAGRVGSALMIVAVSCICFAVRNSFGASIHTNAFPRIFFCNPLSVKTVGFGDTHKDTRQPFSSSTRLQSEQVNKKKINHASQSPHSRHTRGVQKEP
ncbi:hypothetical protein BDU57DRAFT_523159 [Ampelomyces quisqualis]|uniref:Uncharacterized protein n=1 Tax=Ampelomyces quisqualis TaxID=50730 RepID=A0A6A5QBJ5_AMPQU|nr:hypothetical protein BDU57DRAFT_523159 [Ampelomyces quisqualis]